MAGLVVDRMRRYGRDRLYVHDEAGHRIGWLELATGEVTVEKRELADELRQLLRRYEESLVLGRPEGV